MRMIAGAILIVASAVFAFAAVSIPNGGLLGIPSVIIGAIGLFHVGKGAGELGSSSGPKDS